MTTSRTSANTIVSPVSRAITPQERRHFSLRLLVENPGPCPGWFRSCVIHWRFLSPSARPIHIFSGLSLSIIEGNKAVPMTLIKTLWDLTGILSQRRWPFASRRSEGMIPAVSEGPNALDGNNQNVIQEVLVFFVFPVVTILHQYLFSVPIIITPTFRVRRST